MQLKTLDWMHEAAIRGLWKVKGNGWIGEGDQTHWVSWVSFSSHMSLTELKGSLNPRIVYDVWRESSKRNSLFLFHRGLLWDREIEGKCPVDFFSWLCPQASSISKAVIWWQWQHLGRHLKIWEKGIFFDCRNCDVKSVWKILIIALSFYVFPPLVLRGWHSLSEGMLEGNNKPPPFEPVDHKGDSFGDEEWGKGRKQKGFHKLICKLMGLFLNCSYMDLTLSSIPVVLRTKLQGIPMNRTQSSGTWVVYMLDRFEYH